MPSPFDRLKCRFTLTPAGVEVAERRAKDGRSYSDCDWPEADEDARAFYYDRLAAALTILHDAKPEDRGEIGRMGIPVSMFLRRMKKQPA